MSDTTPCDQQHIVLVGMMGVGKSSVGRALARRLDRPLLDTDTLVERRAGRSVREIWGQEGEVAFRDLESTALAEALGEDRPSVIAAAGGVVLRDDNRVALLEASVYVVWLLADVDVLLERVGNGMHRPALDHDPEKALRAMLESRATLYREVADAIVSVDHRSVSDVTQAVLRCCV